MQKIAVLASHEGTTLQAVVDACASGRIRGTVAIVLSNNGNSGALSRASAGHRHAPSFCLHIPIQLRWTRPFALLSSRQRLTWSSVLGSGEMLSPCRSRIGVVFVFVVVVIAPVLAQSTQNQTTVRWIM